MTDPEKSPREHLGLDLAATGDPKGAAVFLDFVQRELYAMAYLGGLPEPIAQRLGELQRAIERSYEFIAGFNTGKAAPPGGGT